MDEQFQKCRCISKSNNFWVDNYYLQASEMKQHTNSEISCWCAVPSHLLVFNREIVDFAVL
jgi:hypothetical protein